MPNITRVHTDAKHYVGIRRQVPVTELKAYFMEVLPKVMGWLATQGHTPASMPMAIWHSMDMEKGIADVQAGCFVTAPATGQDEITSGTIPAGDALRCIHVGGYQTVGQSWGAIYARAAELGLKPGSGYEIYVDDPGKVDEAALRTEISLPVG